MLIIRMKAIRIAILLALVVVAVGLSEDSPKWPEVAKPRNFAAAASAVAKVRTTEGTPLPGGPAQSLQGFVGDTSYEQCVTICEGIADGCRETGLRKGDCAAIYLGCVRRCATKYAK
jgi:hypothetical protein